MAANSFTSRTSPVATTTATQVCPAKREGAFILIKYDKGNGTSIAIAPTFIFGGISATDEYQPLILDSVTPTTQTYSFSTSGNYQIPIGIAKGATKMKVLCTFTGGTTATVVCDIVIQ